MSSSAITAAAAWMRPISPATCSRSLVKSSNSNATTRSLAVRMVLSSSLSSWVMNRSQLARVCLRMYSAGTWS